MEELAESYQLVFYDQRGTSLTDGQLDMAAITIDQFVDDLEALRVVLGFEQVSLVGHSWGAIIAISYAIKYPAHLDRLVLVDSIPVTRRFIVELSETLQQRIGGLSPEAQQMVAPTCTSSLAKLTAMQAPTLILHGDFDPIPIASSEYIQQQIPASQLFIFTENGHFPFIEQPEQFITAIRTFMRR